MALLLGCRDPTRASSRTPPNPVLRRPLCHVLCTMQLFDFVRRDPVFRYNYNLPKERSGDCGPPRSSAALGGTAG